ncbi:uncharacterized protein LOC119586026 [Penaeus monodon]|uniref:uncharacterized protein LOC119586026 n=1 Tax=Penaeus monodon TaxID=6687 RepID=UPI0018A7B1C5|nr:uncharacterized protein LOC119586026 [Penaeus monodon]
MTSSSLKQQRTYQYFDHCTLSEDHHLEYLENEISKIKWDVIGIREMRRPGENATQLPNQHILFHRGNDKKQGGVRFLIHKKLKGNITEFHATSDKVASVTIKISKRYDIKIIRALCSNNTIITGCS